MTHHFKENKKNLNFIINVIVIEKKMFWFFWVFLWKYKPWSMFFSPSPFNLFFYHFQLRTLNKSNIINEWILVIFFYFIPLLKEYLLLGQLKMNLGFKEEDRGKQKELLAVFPPLQARQYIRRTMTELWLLSPYSKESPY